MYFHSDFPPDWAVEDWVSPDWAVEDWVKVG